jgi:hypothetical protein
MMAKSQPKQGHSTILVTADAEACADTTAKTKGKNSTKTASAVSTRNPRPYTGLLACNGTSSCPHTDNNAKVAKGSFDIPEYSRGCKRRSSSLEVLVESAKKA